jgi:hypothetical protein
MRTITCGIKKMNLFLPMLGADFGPVERLLEKPRCVLKSIDTKALLPSPRASQVPIFPGRAASGCVSVILTGSLEADIIGRVI